MSNPFCFEQGRKRIVHKEGLEKVIVLDSRNPQANYFEGIASIRVGIPQRATELFKMFLKMASYAPEAEHAKFLVDTLC